MDRQPTGMRMQSEDPANRPSFASRPSLGDEVYQVILAELISLRIPPGERLSVDALVRQFGVSQTPIRAALIRLEAEGLVSKKHNSGYSATSLPSGKRFADIYEFRMLLEPAAAAGAARRATPELVAQLESLATDMQALVTDDPQANYSRFAQLDGDFHRLLAEACGNEVIEEALGRLYTHMHLFRLRYHSAVAEEAVKEHLLIIGAIREGRDQDAAEAMRTHIAASQARMKPYYQALG